MLRKLLIVACLLSVTLYVSARKKDRKHKATTQAQTNQNYKVIGAPMPDILVLQSSGKLLTNKDVANDANLLVMLFNPTCTHCEDMTVMLQKNIGLFKKSKILMVAASAMQPYMANFEKSFNIEQYPTMMVGVDSAKIIDKTFTYEGLPQINIYDKDRKLVKILAGEKPIDSLKRYIE